MFTVETPYSIHRRFAQHYLNRLNVLAEKLETKSDPTFVDTLALLDEDLDQIRQAISWLNNLSSEDSGLALIAMNLLKVNPQFLRLRLTNEEMLMCTRMALEAARRFQDEEMVRHCLHQLGLAYRDIGRYDESIVYSEELLELSRRTADRRNEARALFLLGTVDKHLGRPVQARQKFETGIALLHQMGDRSGTYGAALVNLANIYAAEHQYEDAIPLLQEALTLFREQQDLFRLCYALNNLGNAYNGLERYSEALAILNEGIEIARAIGQNDALNSLLGNSGYIQLRQGDVESAQAYLEDSIKASKAVGDVYTQLTYSALLIYITMTPETLPESNRQLCHLLIEASEYKMIDVVLQVLAGVAKGYLLAGEPVRSLQLLDFVGECPEIDYECSYSIVQVRQELATTYPHLASVPPLEDTLEDIVANLIAKCD